MEHNNNNAPHGQQNLHDQIAGECRVNVEIAKAAAKGKLPRLLRMPPMLPVISEEDEFSDIENEWLPLSNNEFSDIENEGEIPLPLRTNHERPSTNVNNLEFWGKLKVASKRPPIY